MTPEGSQSSEELQNSEELHSAAPSSSSSGNNAQIRVKNVSEINSNEAEANPSPPPKRKLPSWMLPSLRQLDSANNKKRKTQSDEIQTASTSSTVVDHPESSVTLSNSSNDIQEDVEHNALPNQPNIEAGNIEDGNNLEASTNGEAHVNDEENLNSEAEEKEAVVPSSDPSIAGTSCSNGQSCSSSVVAVKTEPTDKDDTEAVGLITRTSPKDIKPAVKVEKEEATSSTSRISCKFGIRCYRQNPIHRREEAHPGDKDYRRPDFPTPPAGTPDCPFGDLCYRRNPVHFQQYSHPPQTDFEQNWKNYKLRLRQRKQRTSDPNSSNSNLDDDEDDYDLNDPFINDDSDEDFIPDDNEIDEEDDDL